MRNFLHYIGIHLRKDTKVIRIPARHAFLNAYQEWLRDRGIEDDSKEFRKAIITYINKGEDVFIKKLVNKYGQDIEEIEL